MVCAGTKVLSTIAVGAAVTAGAWLIRSAEANVASVDGVVDGTIVTMRTPVAGSVHPQHLTPGQRLEAGDTIAQIEPVVDAEVTAPAPLPGLSGGFSRVPTVSPTNAAVRITALEIRLAHLREKANALPIAAQPSQGRAPVTVPVEAPDLTGHERSIQSAQAEVEAAEAAEAAAGKVAEKADFLLAEGAIAAKDAERARENHADARGALGAAQGRLQRAKEALADAKSQGERPSPPPPPVSSDTSAAERAKIEAEIAQTEREIERLRQLPNTVSRVARPRPFFGGIGGLRPITPFVPEGLVSGEPDALQTPTEAFVWEVIAKPSVSVAANSPIVRLLKSDKLWVQAYFTPETAKHLRLGASVEVWIGDAKQEGRIVAIGAKPFWSSVAAAREAPKDAVSVRVELLSQKPTFSQVGSSARVILRP